MVPTLGYDPSAAALSRLYLTIRSSRHYLVPGTGIEPVFAALSRRCLRVYKAPS
jgi:hypothetical protein